MCQSIDEEELSDKKSNLRENKEKWKKVKKSEGNIR